MIYLGSPYSHSDPIVRNQRVTINAVVLRYLMEGQQLTVFSPLVHFDTMEKIIGVKLNEDAIMRCCLDILAECDTMYVLQLDGWEVSRGLKKELALANELGLIIEYHTPISILKDVSC